MSEEHEELSTDIKDDYEHARSKYYSLLERGEEAIEIMLTFVQDSESPRAMEVFSNMLKQNAEIADRLLELQKKKQDIEVGGKKPALSHNSPNGLTQNNVFVGSTTELQRFLRSQEKEIDHGE